MNEYYYTNSRATLSYMTETNVYTSYKSLDRSKL